MARHLAGVDREQLDRTYPVRRSPRAPGGASATDHQPQEDNVNKIITLTELVAEWPALVQRDQAANVLREQGYRIVEDEIGRPGLTVADVKKWRASDAEKLAADDTRQAQFAAWQASNQAWAAGRTEAARAAAATARGKKPGLSPGAAHASGREAAIEAAEHYERTVPRPVFDGKTGVPLSFVAEDKVGSLVGRVKSSARRVLG